MIKDNQVIFNRLHVVLDGIAVAVSFALAFIIKFMSPFADTVPGETALSTGVYFSSLYFFIPLYLVLYSATSLYTSKRLKRIRTERWLNSPTRMLMCSRFLVRISVRLWLSIMTALRCCTALITVRSMGFSTPSSTS